MFVLKAGKVLKEFTVQNSNKKTVRAKLLEKSEFRY